MCGIAGIISYEKQHLNINEFNILGCLNDERGGDGCGIFIDGLVKKGIDELSYYRNFINTVVFPERAKFALIHCRATSAICEDIIDQVQPVVIYNNDGVAFVLLHNGTISNYKELASKYIPEFDIKNLSDSQVIAQIIYNKGYDVLEEYKGTGVFVFVDYRESKPVLRLFKGSSIYNPKDSKYERPLYIMQYSDRFYFSSMVAPLKCINFNYKPLTIKSNFLIKINYKYELIIEREFDRNKIEQSKIEITSAYNNYPNTQVFQQCKRVPDRIYYNKFSGLYTIHEKPINGCITAWPSGYIINSHYAYNTNDYYFIDGKLLYNKKCYDFLQEILNKYPRNLFTNYDTIIDYFSYTPIMIDGEYMRVNENFQYVPDLVDNWVNLFTECYKYNINSRLLSKISISVKEAYDEFIRSSAIITFNFEELEKSIENLLK